jgi:tetratricopeptide (TPR) repeat protein
LREKLLLAALALLAFGASLSGSFQFDDFGLLSDPAVTSPSGWWESWRLVQTRPLTWFTFWLNYQAVGEHPALWHAVNLALHVGIVLLLFDFLQRLLPERAAWIAAAVFAVHPILAEPVNYIYARGTLLAALFSLLCTRAWMAQGAWQAVAWFALAMLSKEECAAVPVVLAVLDHKRRKPLATMFGVALAGGLRTIWAASVVKGSQAGSQAGISPIDYLATQGTVVWRYARMLAVPWGFTVDAEISKAPLWLGVLGWIALAALAGLVLRRSPLAGFLLTAGIVLLLPSSSVFPATDLAADRRMYLPMLALCPLAGLIAGAPGPERWHSGRSARLPRIAAGILLAGLLAISVRQSLLWRTPESLWTEAVARAPHKVRPRLQLARAVEPRRALALLNEAAQSDPQDASVASEQGRVLLILGHPEEALAAFGRALALDPEDPRNLNNRGAALLALAQTDAAKADFRRALEKDPCLFDARLNLRRLRIVTQPQGCRYTPQQRAALEPPR